MQPLKITLPGNYWDVQIYRDRLYLWDMSGKLSIYDWEKSLEPLFSRDLNIRLPIITAFSRGDYLYGANFDLIFSDEEFKDLLQNKFVRIQDEIEIQPLKRGEQDTPFKELHIDSEIYNNQLYAITSGGLWSATAHRNDKKYPVSSRPKKRWDAYLQSIKAHSNKLAIAGGSDGLFEYRISGEDIYTDNFYHPEDKITQLSEKHSLYATWAFSSIYSTSDIGSSVMIANYWSTEMGENRLNFGNIYDYSDIFGNTVNGSISWAENEKIYYLHNSTLKAVNFNQSGLAPDNDMDPFQEIYAAEITEYAGQEIIMADTVQFGTVIEDMDGLTVFRSDGEIYRINGPITRWRVYPRSKRYENHLHVVLDDRIEIYSFNHDYFVDQKSKIFGIQHRESQSRFGRKTSSSLF